MLSPIKIFEDDFALLGLEESPNDQLDIFELVNKICKETQWEISMKTADSRRSKGRGKKKRMCRNERTNI